MARKTLTPEERERIIDQRLAGVPVRAVAANVGCTTRTVVETMKKYLTERAAAYSARTDATIARLVGRHLAAADAAAQAAEQAENLGDHGSAARYLAEERARLQEVAKLSGLYVEKVEQTVGFQVLRIGEQVDTSGPDS